MQICLFSQIPGTSLFGGGGLHIETKQYVHFSLNLCFTFFICIETTSATCLVLFEVPV